MLVAYLDSYDEVFLLAGAAATGKTTLVADVLKEVDSATPLFLLDAARLTEAGLVAEVCDRLDIDTDALDWEQTLEHIGARLGEYEHAFLVIDNAHELTERDLDALRLLSYLRSGRGPQLQMILVGHDAMLDKIDDTEMLRLELWRSRRARLGVAADAAESGSTASVHSVAEVTAAAGQSEETAEAAALTPPVEDDVRADLAAMVVRPSVTPEPVTVPVQGTTAIEHWRQRVSAPGPWLLAIPVVLVLVYSLFFSGGSETVDQPDALAVSNAASSDAPQNGHGKDAGAIDPVAAEAALAAETPSPDVSTPDVSTPDVSTPDVSTDSLALLEEPAAQAPAGIALQPAPEAVELSRVIPAETGVTRSAAEGEAGLSAPGLLSDLSSPEPDTGMEDDSSVDGNPGGVGESSETEVIAKIPAPTDTATREAAAAETDSPETIAELMAAAADALRQNRLRTPPEVSAWNYYDQVLALSPENEQALRGMQNIVRRYEELTRLAITQERFITAQTFINRGLSVVPDDSGLLALQEELDKALNQPETEEDLAGAALPPDEASEESVAAAEEEESAEPGGFIGFLREVFSAGEE